MAALNLKSFHLNIIDKRRRSMHLQKKALFWKFSSHLQQQCLFVKCIVQK